MDTKNLLTLKTIIRTGSFQNAAEALGYTPSTITFQIRQLEQELSIKLFEKIGRRMILTKAGESILPLVDTVLQSCDTIHNYGKALEQLQGSLTVAMPETLLIYRMQEVLVKFKEQAPNVKLYIQVGNCDKVREEVLSGGIDIGIHYDVCAENMSVCAETIGEHWACLVAYPELDEQESDFISTDQVKKVDLINYYADSIFQNIIDDYLKKKHILISTTMELWSIEAIKKNIINKIGIAYLPEIAVMEELNLGVLKKLDTKIENNVIPAVCEYHKNKWISPQMELFLKLIRETSEQPVQ